VLSVCQTRDWVQRVSSTTTATPEHRATPWEVARLLARNALKGAAANNAIWTKGATH
jgi:hypothetical protein